MNQLNGREMVVATPILISNMIEMNIVGGDISSGVTITIYSGENNLRNETVSFSVAADDFSVLADDLEWASLILKAKNLELEAQGKIDPN